MSSVTTNSSVTNSADKETAEYNRVKLLAEFDLDYQELHKEFEGLTKLAATIADTEISLLNLIDSYLQWSVSGTSPFDVMPREESVCEYTLKEASFFEVPRLDQDPRFQDRDYVKGKDGLKYYFGIPLKVNSDTAIGALCVLSSSAKELSKSQIQKLHLIAGEIVARLELKLELSRAQRKFNKEYQTKKRLAHDIRGPIGGIIQLLDLAKLAETPSHELTEILDLAKKSGQNLLNLTEEILNEVLENRKEKEDSFDLTSFAEKLRSLYTPQAMSKEVDFNVNIEDKTSTLFSKKDLLPVIGNLISNSIKFTPPGGEVSVSIGIFEEKSSKHLYTTVKDTGTGMSEDKLNQLVSGTVKSEDGTVGEKGHGLGLRLVMDLVEELDGKIEFASTLGEGTTITVSLPLTEQ